MTLNDVVFIEKYPKLDLHGYDRETARVMIEDFIKENQKMKQEVFVIVHGIGSGILREETHKALKRNPFVLEYKTYYYNNGCTLVHIKIEKNNIKNKKNT